ncbi:ATP-binding protein [Parapedobacter sp. GCM10030251]|uniref:sensor histidine kinase n=1 Tax=Parapedobacter sp. GCM10030251 TaxID=3273419 RepID=UPI003609F918
MYNFVNLVQKVFISLIGVLIAFHYTRATDNPYILNHYTDEHNLPQNSIKGIGQDNLGFVWLITEKGPVRYDGEGRFKTFDSLSQSMKSIRMAALYKGDRFDDLIAKSEHGETVLLKNGTATTLRSGNDIISSLSSRYKDNIFFNLSLPSPYSQYHNEYVFIPDGSEGGFLISQDSISHVTNRGNPSTARYFPNEGHWNFASDHGKLIYFNQTLEYVEIGGDLTIKKGKISGDASKLPPHTRFKILWNSSSDQLFIYTTYNLYRLSRDENGGLHSQLLISGFDFDKQNIITAHDMPKQNQLLLGSGTKGLFVFKKRFFKSLVADDAYSNLYYNQTLLPNGLLLTDNGMAFDSTGHFRFAPPLHLHQFQHGQIIGPDGNVWILRNDNVLVAAPGLDRIVEIKPFPALPRVAFYDDSNQFWIGGGKGALLKYDAKNDTFCEQATFSGSINNLEQKNKDELFASTFDRLYIFNKVTRTWSEIPQFRNKQIRSIRNESDQRYWITTYQHGFYLYEDGQITSFPLDQNLYLSTSHCTLEDRNGFIWISTNKGLFKVSKRQLLDYKNDRRKTPFYFYYNKQWGFQTNEFNGGCLPCAIELPNGSFSFPSLDGLVQFNPLAITEEFPSGKIILDDIVLDDKSLAIEDVIHIPHHFSRLDIKLAAPFYGNPNNIQIDYMLYNKRRTTGNWVPLNLLNNTLSINELSSGDHEVRVRIRNGINSDDFHVETFRFYVQPLFYETWWFIGLSCIAISGVIWLVIYLRTQFVLRQNRLLVEKVNERTNELTKQYEWQQRLSASITHDIKAPLSYVVKALYAMKSVAGKQTIAPEDIEHLYHSTHHIYHYSNNLTELAKVMFTKVGLKFGDVYVDEIVERQITIFQPVADLRGNLIHNSVPPKTSIRSQADILSVIIHNILDNAIKFTKRGKISIYSEIKQDNRISLCVADTGVGLTPDQITHFHQAAHVTKEAVRNGDNNGLGLMLAKDMANLIQAEISIRSTRGKGTTVIITLPHTA